jgi:RimJ/RimL family protein N-acetyltransferase
MKQSYDETPFLNCLPSEFSITQDEEAKFIKNINSKENSIFIIAELDNKVIGTLLFKGEERKKLCHQGEIGMAVLKEFWGQKIGSKLLNFALSI